MTALRVLVADDEEMARRRLRRLLSVMTDVELVGECATGEAALSMLETVDVDVAVLDVQMPGLTGLDVSQAAAELGVEVIFATAHPEHAVTAFDRGVVDFVLKPVEAERLAVAIERARARMSPLPREELSPVEAPLDRLALTVGGDLRLFAVADIACAVLEGSLVRLRAGSEVVWTELSLQELEDRLGGRGFLRVHRRALLHLAHVTRLRPLATGGYLAITRQGDEVPVSRKEARRLRQRLGL